MLRRTLALVLLVNVFAVVPNLPRILAAVDGESVGATLGAWSVGVGTAGGDLVEDIAAGAPDADEVLRIQEELASDELTSPTDDPAVAELVTVWRLLQGAADQVDVEALADQLVADVGDRTAASSDVAVLLAAEELDVEALAAALGDDLDPAVLRALLDALSARE